MSSDTWNNGDLESEDDPTSRHDEPAAATKKSESPTHVATPVVNGERSKLDTTMDMNPGTRAFNSNSRIGYFSSLPLEILELIINNIKDTPTIAKLSRTCKQFHSIMMPLFHKRFMVDIDDPADIPKLIHAINPYLTFAQIHQLETGVEDRSQQQHLTTNVDSLDKPTQAGYVRQVVLGPVDLEFYHENVIHRYIEEAFKNMNNTEVVETSVLTDKMAENIASLHLLKALRLSFKKFPSIQDLRPLTRVKNLKHLYFDALDEERIMMDGDEIMQSMVANSKSTLQSLVFRTYNFGSRFVPSPDQLGPPSHTGYLLTALKSLEIAGISVDESLVTALDRTINFLGLEELFVGPFRNGKDLFFQNLASLARRTHSDDIQLRNVILSWMNNSPEMAQDHQASCDFLASFDTLATLRIENYLHLPEEDASDTGLPDIVLQAVLNHKGLGTLSFSYGGTGAWYKIPFLTPTKVASVVDTLPHLRDFQFIMVEGKEEETGAVLARGRRLESISFWSHLKSCSLDFDEVIQRLHGVLDGLLNSNSFNNSGKDEFIWEDHFELRHLKVLDITWEIGSRLESQGKGLTNARQRFSRNKKRSVWYRDITESLQQPQGTELYRPDSGWVDKVAPDMDVPLFW